MPPPRDRLMLVSSYRNNELKITIKQAVAASVFSAGRKMICNYLLLQLFMPLFSQSYRLQLQGLVLWLRSGQGLVQGYNEGWVIAANCEQPHREKH